MDSKILTNPFQFATISNKGRIILTNNAFVSKRLQGQLRRLGNIINRPSRQPDG